jgi:N-terminal half of MaoC dehydratase
MPDQVETLVTPGMRERKGIWSSEQVSYPISSSDIRKWAIAVYWPKTPPRLFWDEEYARTTRWGGIIAPQDFNPFGWPIKSEPSGEGAPTSGHPPTGRRGMNGGQSDTYFTPMRPGDVIRARHRIRDWNETKTRLGLTLFFYTETEWHNQNDELVKRHIQTFIWY